MERVIDCGRMDVYRADRIDLKKGESVRLDWGDGRFTLFGPAVRDTYIANVEVPKELGITEEQLQENRQAQEALNIKLERQGLPQQS